MAWSSWTGLRPQSVPPVFDVVAWAPSVVLEGGPRARGAAGPPRAACGGRPRRDHRPPRRGLWVLRGALAPPAATRAADTAVLPGRPGGGGSGLAAPAYRLVRPAHADRRPGRFGCMRFGLQIPNFTAGDVTRRPLRRRRGHGDRGRGHGLRLGVGDGPLLPTAPAGRAQPAHARLLHAARRAGGQDVEGAARHHGDRRHLPQPGPPGQDRDDPRRDQRGPGHPWHRRGLVRRRARRARASTSRPPASGSVGWRRRCRSAAPCSPRRRRASTAPTTGSTRRATCLVRCSRAGRRSWSGAAGRSGRCGSWRATPTCATSSATPPPWPTRSTSCGATARRSGRDPAEVTVSRLSTLVLTASEEETAATRDFLRQVTGEEPTRLGHRHGRRAGGPHRGAGGGRASSTSCSTCPPARRRPCASVGEVLVGPVRRLRAATGQPAIPRGGAVRLPSSLRYGRERWRSGRPARRPRAR